MFLGLEVIGLVKSASRMIEDCVMFCIPGLFSIKVSVVSGASTTDDPGYR